jgi:hypothetical protein
VLFSAKGRGDIAADAAFPKESQQESPMNDEKQPRAAEDQPKDRRPDKARAGGKPGKLGDTDTAPEHDPAMEKAGRREFGRDG